MIFILVIYQAVLATSVNSFSLSLVLPVFNKIFYIYEKVFISPNCFSALVCLMPE